MAFIDVVRYRLRSLFRPGSYGRDLDDELTHHLELDAINARAGDGVPLSADDARRQARRAFGNLTYASEERRIVSGIALFDSVRHDVYFVLRLLRRRAVFAAVTVATIALGIGAATSIYSVADAVIFRPLAFPDPARLITVWLTRPAWKLNPGQARNWDRGGVSLPLFHDWRAAQSSFDHVAAWTTGSTMVVVNGEAPEEVNIIRASASLLSVLGVRLERGTGFTPAQDAVGGAPVAYVSHETWVAQLASDPNVLGRTVLLSDLGLPADRAKAAPESEGTRYTIVGVLPAGLTLDRNGPPAAYWVPVGQDAEAAESPGRFDYYAIGRLRRGVSLTAAAAESERLLAKSTTDSKVRGMRLATLQDDQTRTVRLPLLILLGAAGVLLAIACCNVAALLLGEAASRERELRTRTALGAGRRRLFRQLLTESLVLAGIGGVGGAALATAGTRLIVRSAPAGIPGIADVGVDGRVLFVALLVVCATGVLFGLAPAFSLVRSSGALGVGDRTGGHAARGRGRGQRVLIACEVALSMVLLVGSGLLVRSLNKMTAIAPGFRTSGLLVVRLRLPQPQYADSVRARAVYRDILDRVKSLPGVLDASATTTPPFSGGSSTSSFELEGDEPAAGKRAPSRSAQRRVTTPGFFATAGIPVVAGRDYTDADGVGAAPVVVVSRSFERREWPAGSALGKRIKLFSQWRAVVGVAADIKTGRPSADSPETIYAPFAQVIRGSYPALIVRTRPAVATTAAELRRVVHDVAADVAIGRANTMDEMVAASLADDRLRTVLITLFAAIAALLAAVGTYGVAATAASRRTREMAIRVAVGASSGSVARLIVGSAAAGVAAGAVAGVGLALIGVRVLAPYLYGVGTTDPAAYASVVVLLAVTTVAATWIPARRAMRVRLVDTLRAD